MYQQTLRSLLGNAAQKHGLCEIADRLLTLCSEQQEIDQVNHDQWSKVIHLLEQLTDESAKLTHWS